MAPFSKGRFPPGKKGMRQNNGKKPSIRLKPRPNAPAHVTAAANGDGQRGLRDGMDTENDDDEQSAAEDEEDEGSKPLAGVVLTVSGCGQYKTALLDLAEQLGAVSDINMTHETTHLITDSAGSPKYEMAVKRRFKIMMPSWLEAVRQRWTSAESLDLDQIYEEHKFKPFQGVVLSLTQFQSGPYKKELMMKLAGLGADVRNKLYKEATHLVVASSTSPHSPQQNQAKLESALQLQAEFPRLAIVWEKWLNEVINLGGQLKERQDFWTWQRGIDEPEDDPLQEYPLEERSKKRLLPQNSTVLTVLTDQNDPLMPAHKKAKTRPALHEDNVEALIERYRANEAGPSTAKPVEEPKAMTMEMRAEGMALGARSKSVIKALATSKSAVLSTSNEARARQAKQLKPRSMLNPNASAKDDSAFFEEVSEIVNDETRIEDVRQAYLATSTVATDESLSILSGVKVWLGLRDAAMNSKAAQLVSDLGGDVVNDIQSAMRVIVDVTSPWPAEVEMSDDRVRTAVWFQHYCDLSDSTQADACPLARPLAYEGAIDGARKLKLYFSQSYVDDSSRDHERFRRVDALRTTVTHFVHPLGDSGDLLDDPRREEMERHGIEIVGMNFMRRWIASHSRPIVARLPPRTASTGVTSKIKSEVRTEFARSDSKGELLGHCKVMFTPKISSSERQRLADLAVELGATHVKALEDDPTHLIHIGSRVNDLSALVKQARKAGVHVVHPAWIEKCYADDACVKEAEFPHTLDPRKGLQLSGFVSSQVGDHQEPSTDDTGLEVDAAQLRLRASQDRKTRERPSPVVLESMTNIPRATNKANEARTVTRSPSPLGDEGSRAAAAAILQSTARNASATIPSPKMSPIARTGRSSTPESPADGDLETVGNVAAPSMAEQAYSAAAPTSKTLLKEQTSLLLAQLAKDSHVNKQSRTVRRKPNHTGSTASPTTNILSGAVGSPHAEPNFIPPQTFIRNRLPDVFDNLDTQSQTMHDESLYVKFEDPEEVKAREEIRRKLDLGGKGSKRSPRSSRFGRKTQETQGDDSQTPLRRSSRKSR
ncbi:protein kinase activating protein dpb11 [Microbotryomycetes sp. JL201]|nr:protein kinase activating protein dpb11 [Microbotryomycetes sp. JL201]